MGVPCALEVLAFPRLGTFHSQLEAITMSTLRISAAVLSLVALAACDRGTTEPTSLARSAISASRGQIEPNDDRGGHAQPGDDKGGKGGKGEAQPNDDKGGHGRGKDDPANHR